MTWLEKMDAVLFCLNDLKSTNPKFTDLQNWLQIKYPEVQKGEIQDITLYLWTEGMMYFDNGGGHRLSVYDDRKEDGHYLISCKGKLFLEEQTSYVQKKINDDAENKRVGNVEKFQKANARQMTCLTIVITVATVVLGIQGILAIIDWFSSHYWCK